MLLNCGVGGDSWDSLGLQGHQPIHPKGNQSWIFIGRTDATILWPPVVKNRLIGKDPDAGKDWRQEEKRMTEDEMAGWHHWLNGHEFAQAPGVSDGQGSLACCSPWCCKESDTTEQLNWTVISAWIASYGLNQSSVFSGLGTVSVQESVFREHSFSDLLLEVVSVPIFFLLFPRVDLDVTWVWWVETFLRRVCWPKVHFLKPTVPNWPFNSHHFPFPKSSVKGVYTGEEVPFSRVGCQLPVLWGCGVTGGHCGFCCMCEVNKIVFGVD